MIGARQKIHMTDSRLVFDGKIIKIFGGQGQGEIMKTDMAGSQLTLFPNMLISKHYDSEDKTEKMIVNSNPDSRRLPIGD